MRRLRLLIPAVLVTVAACAGASMDPELGQRYAVSVVNEMPHPMIVSVDDGAGTRVLGTVGADREERFVLRDGGTVTIVATDREDTHTVRRTVVLEAGGTVEVRLN